MIESILEQARELRESDKEGAKLSIPCLVDTGFHPIEAAIIVECPDGGFVSAIVDGYLVSFDEEAQPGRLVKGHYKGAKVIKSDEDSVTVDLQPLELVTGEPKLTLPRSLLEEKKRTE